MFSLLGRMLIAALLCWSWHVQATPAPKSMPAPAPDVVSQSDCFEAWSYDEWMDYLWERNSFLNYVLIRWKFSEDEFERYRRELECRSITYRSDRYTVHAWLVRPKNGGRRGAKPGGDREKVPVIIYNRGGNRSHGVLTFAHLFTHVFPLAERGYLVAASQYRGATTPQDSGPSPDQFGGDDVRDVTKLMRIVAALPGVDTRNFFMIGQSRGAIMTFRALLETPLPIRAVAIHSGVYDAHDLLEFRPVFDQLFEVLIPRYRQRRKAELDLRSVTRWADRLPPQTGVLMLHGDNDRRAPLVSARKLAAELERLGRPHEIIVYRGESHYLDGVRAEAREQTVRWFRRFRWRPLEDGGTAR